MGEVIATHGRAEGLTRLKADLEAATRRALDSGLSSSEIFTTFGQVMRAGQLGHQVRRISDQDEDRAEARHARRPYRRFGG